jgi:hypothetical protein
MRLKFLVTFALLGLTLKSGVVKSEGGGGNMCGMAAPDPMKHCISLRLPWQSQPLYFCMGIKIINNKNNNLLSHC